MALKYGGLVGSIDEDGVILIGGLRGQLTGDLTDGTFTLGGLSGRIEGGIVYYGGLIGSITDGVLSFGGLVGEATGGPTPPPPGPPDPYFANVEALLHFDGDDEGTVFTDQIGHTFAANSGSPVTDTAAPKWGSACASFPATNASIQSSSFEADFDFTNTFTFEFWLKVPNLAGTASLLAWWQNGAPSERYLYITGSKITANNGWAGFFTITFPNALTANTWQHVAICADGSVTRTFLDGVLQATANSVCSASAIARKIQFGSNAGTVGGNLIMFIDDFRYTRGIARYTATFTPPDAAFPNYGP